MGDLVAWGFVGRYIESFNRPECIKIIYRTSNSYPLIRTIRIELC